MNQLRRNIVMAFSLLALQACGSGSTDSTQPPGGGDDTTPSLTCGSSKLHSARHDACAPMVAQGEGACGCISMGWTWDGSACVALAAGACKCVGEDCDKLAQSKEECETNHAACLPVTKKIACGAAARFQSVHVTCPAMDVRGQGACGCISMGWTWNGSACVPLEGGACECVGEDCDKLAKSKEECETSHAACLPELKSVECGSHMLFEQVHDNCGRMDVRGDGACNCISMGWTWDGTGCAPLAAGACKCVGQDCDKLSPTQQDCLSKHAACL